MNIFEYLYPRAYDAVKWLHGKVDKMAYAALSTWWFFVMRLHLPRTPVEIVNNLVVSALDFSKNYALFSGNDITQCMCCGGNVGLHVWTGHVESGCGVNKANACEEKTCPVTDGSCKKFDEAMRRNRDLWFVFKAWLVSESIHRLGWCVLKDSRHDLLVTIAIVCSKTNALVRVLKGGNDVIVHAPGAPIPSSIARVAWKRVKNVVDRIRNRTGIQSMIVTGIPKGAPRGIVLRVYP